MYNIVNWNKRIKTETVRRALFYNHEIYVYKWSFSEVATEGTEDIAKTNSSGSVTGEDYFFWPQPRPVTVKTPLRDLLDKTVRFIQNFLSG